MNLSVEVVRKVDVTITHVLIKIPTHCIYEDDFGDAFAKLLDKNEDYLIIEVNADTGEITDWTKGETGWFDCKVRDCGTYELWNMNKPEMVGCVDDDYVPDFIPGEYGDYVRLDVEKDGVITNWKEFFNRNQLDGSKNIKWSI